MKSLKSVPTDILTFQEVISGWPNPKTSLDRLVDQTPEGDQTLKPNIGRTVMCKKKQTGKNRIIERKRNHGVPWKFLNHQQDEL